MAKIQNNRSDFKLRLIIRFYRLAHWASIRRKQSKCSWVVAVPILVAYRIVTEWFFHLELPAATQIGRGLIIDHGFALVVNKHTIIGDDCRLRHCVTIGCKVNEDGTQGPSPRLGHRVEVGAGAIVIGDIAIGNDAVIGAGAVVTKDVPAGAVVVGNPARVVKIKHQNTTGDVRLSA
ncbi:MAG: serine acetyltransferase [Nitrosomonadales bacterium]|nr:serine acetyltransferase [Nitrosomonadales bacterium]